MFAFPPTENNLGQKAGSLISDKGEILPGADKTESGSLHVCFVLINALLRMQTFTELVGLLGPTAVQDNEGKRGREGEGGWHATQDSREQLVSIVPSQRRCCRVSVAL